MRFRIVVLLAVLITGPARSSSAAWLPDGNPVSSLPGNQLDHELVSDGEGGAFVAWNDISSQPTRIRLSRFRRSGELATGWNPGGILLAAEGGRQAVEALVSDGHSGVYVIWTQQSFSGASLHAKRIMGNGQTAPGWSEQVTRVDLQAIGLVHPVATADRLGGLTLFVGNTRDYVNVNGEPIFAQRLDDRGRALWGSGGIRIGGPDALGRSLRAVADGHGGTFVTWVRVVEGDTDAMLQHLGPDGGPASGWPSTGLAVTRETGSQSSTRLVGDEHGGVIVLWNEFGLDNDQPIGLYAQRVGADGVADWNHHPDGVPVSTTGGAHANTDVCGDGLGGVIAAWTDTRPGGAFVDIYAQRVDANGSVAWRDDGAPVSVEVNFQDQATVTPDFRGGAYLTWLDGRYSHVYAFATHLDVSGEPAPGWPAGGVPVSLVAEWHADPMVAFDRGGTPIVAWTGMSNTFPGSSPHVYVGTIGAEDSAELLETGIRAAIPQGRARAFRESGGAVRVEFELAEDGDARLEVFDVSGRRVASRELGWSTRGENRVSIATAGSLPAGVYLVRIRQADRVHHARVALLH